MFYDSKQTTTSQKSKKPTNSQQTTTIQTSYITRVPWENTSLNTQGDTYYYFSFPQAKAIIWSLFSRLFAYISIMSLTALYCHLYIVSFALFIPAPSTYFCSFIYATNMLKIIRKSAELDQRRLRHCNSL